MSVSLVCIKGPYAGQEFPVDRKGLVIGRDPAAASIVLSADMASRSHAKVYAMPDGGVTVEDLGSTNGTYLLAASGRKKISGKESVKDKQRFSIGDNDYCVFEIRCAASAEAPSYTRAVNSAPQIGAPAAQAGSFQGQWPTPGSIPESMLADRFQRFAARVIDGLVLSITMTIFAFVFGLSAGVFASSGWAILAILMSVSFIGCITVGYIAYLALNIYFLYRNGQTVGKKLMGIKIVSKDGGRASLPGIIFLRMLGMFILEIIPLIGWSIFFINLFFIFRSDRRMIHDFLAGTVVIKA
ncbi:hypothetical protein FACS1894216_14530 [Synergistales bacterium]|nr:hypothetical protein FACS1894216_14530 [Synergistales bacterium]